MMRNPLCMAVLLVLGPVINGQVMLDETTNNTVSSPDANILNNIMGGNIDPLGTIGSGPIDNTAMTDGLTARLDRIWNVNDTGSPDLGIDGGVPFMNERRQRLNVLCEEKCKTELCYLADNDDCRNFITCDRDAQGRYYATLQPCAFGTYWAGLQTQKKITCDLPENVVCNINYCARRAGTRYDHPDGNCKTYWECDSVGKSVPKCCGEGFRYHRRRNVCVVDRARRCHDKCPIKIDACLIPGTKTEYFDDGNCLTFWNCEDRHPHPVCCPDGQGYDAARGCIDNPRCKHECPPQYKPDICLKPGVEKYSLIDGNCRTHMRCNAVEGDERWCCPSGFLFDTQTQACVEKRGFMNISCSDHCPLNYSEVCTLRPHFEKANAYMEDVHGVEIERPCSIGTNFDVTKCGCATIVKGAPDNSCAKELDIVFDGSIMHRSGSQSKVEIIPVGTIQEGPKLNGRISYKFNGDLYFRIPFLQSQYEKLYIKLVYLPELTPGIGRQVYLSNCMNLDLGAPTLELFLIDDRLILTLVTDTIQPNGTAQYAQRVEAAVRITPGIWNTFTAIYDGNNVHLMNEGEGLPNIESRPLTGTVSIAAEGMDFGGCFMFRDKAEGFLGSLAQLEFAKCVNPNWLDRFNSNIPTTNIAIPAGP